MICLKSWRVEVIEAAMDTMRCLFAYQNLSELHSDFGASAYSQL